MSWQFGEPMNCGQALRFRLSKAQGSSHWHCLSTMDNERQRRFTWIYASGAFVLVLVTIFAVAFAVQEHNDRVLSEELSETASELQDTGARIANIRDAEMKNMYDYVRAFPELGPRLDTSARPRHR